LQIEWTFTGPGGGQWAMTVANGQAVVHEGRPPHFDLAFTQSPESFIKTLHRLHDPLMAMLTGEIKVRGFERMGDFDRLFPDSSFGLPMNQSS
jgi:putative sterol carrier protein